MLRTYQTNYRLFSLNFGWRERFTSICHTELQSFIRGHTRSVFLGPELCKVTLCLRTNSFPVFQSPRLIARPGTYRLDSIRCMSVENNGNKYEEIDFVMEMIIQKLNNIGEEVDSERYASIRKTLEILHQHGCIISHVPEFPDVLNLTEEEIKEQAERLRLVHACLLTPDLFLENEVSITILKRKAFYQIQKITGLKTVTELMKMKFECKSQEEWTRLQPYITKQKEALPSMFSKVDYLLQQGISIEEIKKHPRVLILMHKDLKFRIEWITKKCPFVSPRTLLGLCGFTYLQTYKLKLRKGLGLYNIFDGCKTQQEAVNKLMTNYFLEQDYDENENCEEPKGAKIEHLKAIMKNRDYLISVGISPTCMVDNIYCLYATFSDLKICVEETKKVHRKLRCDQLMSNILEKMQKKRQRSFPNLTKLTSRCIQEKLELTNKELQDIQQYLPSTQAGLLESVLSKVNFLLEEGYSREDIKEHPEILTKPLLFIQGRLNRMREGDENSQPSLEVLSMNTSEVSRISQSIQKYRSSLGNAKSKLEALGEMLEVDKHSLSVFDPLKYRQLKDLKPIIEYLWSIGITSESIVNDILCLKMSLKLLKQSVEKLQKDGVEDIDLMQITAVANKMMPQKQPTHQQYVNKTFIRTKLSIPQEEWKKVERTSFRNSSRVLVKNFKLLTDSGFTTDSLRCCPYVIGHSSDVLEEHLQKLKTMEDLLVYKDLFADKRKLVNLLQYIIEKNNYFRRVVNDDEILGNDEARVSLYFSKNDEK